VTLNQWTKDNRFGRYRFRQVLAWLEEQRKATSFRRKEGRRMVVYWVDSEWLSRNGFEKGPGDELIATPTEPAELEPNTEPQEPPT
jgi:hypothetical protein